MVNWKSVTNEMRKDIFLTACSGGVGHLASAFSCVEIFCALYCGGVLHFDKTDPFWASRDRFVLSKGHGSLAYYVALAQAGCIERSELFTFCQPGTRLGGEPSIHDLPYVESTTGSLGHGLPFSVGMALSLKTDQRKERVFVLVGDGECEEGSIWESVMTASHYSLDNLTVILDFNRIQKMDTVKNLLGIDDWTNRFQSFGWDTISVDGHDVDSLTAVLSEPSQTGKPRIVIAKTIKGKGLSLMENDPSWHWRMPNKREIKVFIQELAITQEEMAACKKRI